jgi:hypothetical protein
MWILPVADFEWIVPYSLVLYQNCSSRWPELGTALRGHLFLRPDDK